MIKDNEINLPKTKKSIKLRRTLSFFIHFIWNIRYRLIYLFHGKVVGARALIFRNVAGRDEVMLIRHTYSEGWYTIGGEVDKNELPLEAIKREVFEEVGVKILNDPELMGIYHCNFKNRDDYVFFYIVKEFEIEESYSPEIEESRWFPLDALPHDISPSTKRRIEEYWRNLPITGRW